MAASLKKSVGAKAYWNTINTLMAERGFNRKEAKEYYRLKGNGAAKQEAKAVPALSGGKEGPMSLEQLMGTVASRVAELQDTLADHRAKAIAAQEELGQWTRVAVSLGMEGYASPKE